jgi:hypothetical protein
MFSIKPRLIITGIAFFALVLFVFDYANTKHANKQLRNQLKQANTTIEAQDKKIASEIKINKKETPILKEVYNAPKKDDGPVAPVLRRAIDRL